MLAQLVAATLAWLGAAALVWLLVEIYDPNVRQHSRHIDWQHLFDYADPAAQRVGSSMMKNRTGGLLDYEADYIIDQKFCPNKPTKILAAEEMGYTVELFVGHAFSLHLYGCNYATMGWVGTEAFFFWRQEEHLVHTWDVANWSFSEQTPDWPYNVDRGRNITAGNYTSWERVARQPWCPEPFYRVPPYRAYYQNHKAWKNPARPVAVVAGKHTREWRRDALNSFAKSEILRPILRQLVDAGFIIVYNRPLEVTNFGDIPTDPIPVDDYELIQAEFSEHVIPIQLLFEKWVRLYGIGIVNSILLQLYAEADLFITSQGGNGAIGSLFGKTNILFYAAGNEVWNRTSLPPPPTTELSFPTMTIYTRMGALAGTKILKVETHEDLLDTLARVLLERKSDWQ